MLRLSVFRAADLLDGLANAGQVGKAGKLLDAVRDGALGAFAALFAAEQGRYYVVCPLFWQRALSDRLPEMVDNITGYSLSKIVAAKFESCNA